jgi:hypothetical protein
MKLPALLCALSAAALAAPAVQDMSAPEPAERAEQHRWLEQLAGDWTMTSEMSMGPGTEPMTMEATEHARSLGGLWLVAEGTASIDGDPFHSILTLGYDPETETFVGTWIDTMQTHLWSYRGKLDDARKVLTLDTEGPGFDDPTKTSKYRDAIEVLGPDRKVLTSSVQLADGSWSTFLRAEYQRQQ